MSPRAEAVAVCQQRAAEKAHLARCDASCAPYAVLADESDLRTLGDELFPGILKTAQLGYDRKG